MRYWYGTGVTSPFGSFWVDEGEGESFWLAHSAEQLEQDNLTFVVSVDKILGQVSFGGFPATSANLLCTMKLCFRLMMGFSRSQSPQSWWKCWQVTSMQSQHLGLPYSASVPHLPPLKPGTPYHLFTNITGGLGKNILRQDHLCFYHPHRHHYRRPKSLKGIYVEHTFFKCRGSTTTCFLVFSFLYCFQLFIFYM